MVFGLSLTLVIVGAVALYVPDEVVLYVMFASLEGTVTLTVPPQLCAEPLYVNDLFCALTVIALEFIVHVYEPVLVVKLFAVT